jgi:hypothetical protein
VNHCSPPFLINYIQVSIGDYAEYLDNVVMVWIETRHLFWELWKIQHRQLIGTHLTVYPHEWMTNVEFCHRITCFSKLIGDDMMKSGQT